MNKKLIMKILAGVFVVALSVTVAVTFAGHNDANVNAAAEDGAPDADEDLAARDRAGVTAGTTKALKDKAALSDASADTAAPDENSEDTKAVNAASTQAPTNLDTSAGNGAGGSTVEPAASTEAVYDPPVTKNEPAAVETPAAQQTPAVKETPAVQQTPAVKETPAVQQTPAVEETPAVQQTPAVEETPEYIEIHDCNCGYSTTSYDDLMAHMYNHAINGEAYSYTTVVKKK